MRIAFDYMERLESAEIAFKQNRAPEPPVKVSWRQQLKPLGLLFRSIWDVCWFKWYWGKQYPAYPVVFTAPNFFSQHNGKLTDRVAAPVLGPQVYYINYSKVNALGRVEGRRVIHTGGLVWFLSKCFFRLKSQRQRFFKAYYLVNCWLLKGLPNQVVTLCFYDVNGLSLAWRRHGQTFSLVEIQHGSMIGYPPYASPAPFRIADIFYVRNHATQAYLQTHLNKNYPAEYRLIPAPAVPRQQQAGLHILYASTVEFNGFHPVFQAFLRHKAVGSFHLRVRLHPREQDKEPLFQQQAGHHRLIFDHAPHWLESVAVSNTMVISPWSSCIEEAVDHGFKAIVLDPVGARRYAHLIDEGRCYYTENLSEIIDAIMSATPGHK